MNKEKLETAWCSIPKGNKILFVSVNTSKLITRYDFAEIVQIFDEPGVYLVRKKFSNKYVIFNANKNRVSPKFKKYIFTHDNKHFVVETGNMMHKYQTIYDLRYNAFLNVCGKEISYIKKSDAYAVLLDTKDRTPSYEIFDTLSHHSYGPFVQYDNEALHNYIRVKKELGWQSDTFLLNLETGKQTLSVYEKQLYNEMITSGDPAGVDIFASKISTLTPEMLLASLKKFESQTKPKKEKTSKHVEKEEQEVVERQPGEE